MPEFFHKKTDEELSAALSRKIDQLRRATSHYDEGKLDEAERIASDVYILLSDSGKNSKSLLGQVGKKGGTIFPDSRHPMFVVDPKKFIGLPLCSQGKDGSYIPILDTAVGLENMARHVFSRWWDQTVYITHSGIKLSRRNLVYTLRSQDGGSHVDDNLKSESYHWLKTEGDRRIVSSKHGFKVFRDLKVDNLTKTSVLWFTARIDNIADIIAGSVDYSADPDFPSSFLKNAHWASMRQIGWEVDQALRLANL